ncbi:hypothetical protein P691DRAFT_802123 [Macrolepiota fuliginosa MF-IS2]|uniref:Uncharacterized protein n=1 Tax=Macrolepiota fuliginosa MF-IS2 TaxID=1400762 RepID=A0A9P6C1D2_9AGAR|nr:hypothetical protein P691DRAFT_802123 [Macrolepiota fuliginosa MF-IS2]
MVKKLTELEFPLQLSPFMMSQTSILNGPRMNVSRARGFVRMDEKNGGNTGKRLTISGRLSHLTRTNLFRFTRAVHLRGFARRQPRLDRIYTAFSSFRGSRRWPFEKHHKLGPRYFWDQFRIFVGASGYPPVWNRTDKPESMKKQASASPDFSEDEDDASPKKQPINIQASNQSERKQHDSLVRPPYAYYNVKSVDLDSDEAVRALLELDKLRREEWLIDFLDDPEKAVKIFLSSYSRDQSFWWSDENLDIMPRLLCLFFKFLLKNRVFPEPATERKLQSALRMAGLAHKELSYTSVISKFLTDEFGAACRRHWGSQRKSHSAWSDDEDDLEEDNAAEENRTEADIESGVVLHDISAPLGSKITHISFGEGDSDADKAGAPSLHSGSIPPIPTAAPVSVPEAFQNILTLGNLFPTTHSIGLVERSVRRIKHVLPPGAFASVHAKAHHAKHSSDTIESIDAVETDLEVMLAKVVLTPWVDSGLYGYGKPGIIKHLELAQDGMGETEHDPQDDEITVLVSVASRNLNVLRDAIGMGLAGTWVQLRPVGEDDLPSGRLKYWYLDSLDVAIPSYWTC